MKERKIVNLTRHEATPSQVDAGVVELSPEKRQDLPGLLTFRAKDFMGATREEIQNLLANRATMIAGKAAGYKEALVGGAPYFIPHICYALKQRGITPLFSFSERVAEERIIEGKVAKTIYFEHKFFIRG